jgi:hypothetical protein
MATLCADKNHRLAREPSNSRVLSNLYSEKRGRTPG